MRAQFFTCAADAAKKSLCLRDKCGAVIVKNGKVIGEGYNSPPNNNPLNRKCDYRFSIKNRKKPKADCTCCVHAEWRAIIAALKSGTDITGSTLYFTRVDLAGALVHSGDPYCTVCSRLALDVGIKYWVLWHESGIKIYDAKTYNDISYEFHH